MAMDGRSLRVKAMHKVEVALGLQRLLLADNHDLVFIDRRLDLLEVLLADIVEIHAFDRCAELFAVRS